MTSLLKKGRGGEGKGREKTFRVNCKKEKQVYIIFSGPYTHSRQDCSMLGGTTLYLKKLIFSCFVLSCFFLKRLLQTLYKFESVCIVVSRKYSSLCV